MHESAPLSAFLPTGPLPRTTIQLDPSRGLNSPAIFEGPPVAARVVDAASLLAGARQVVIEHEGKLYRLSLTKNNRLILQK